MYVIPSKSPDALILIFTMIIMEGGFQLQDGVGPRQQLRRAQPDHQQMERTRPGRWLSHFVCCEKASQYRFASCPIPLI